MKAKIASVVAAAMAVCCATAADFYIKDGVHDWTKGENYEGNAAPSSASDKVFVRAGRTVYLDSTDTASLAIVNRQGFIIYPIAADSCIVVDVPGENDTLKLVCEISTLSGGRDFSYKKGVIVKKGNGVLELDSAESVYRYVTRIDIQEGEVHGLCNDGIKPRWGHVSISNNASFRLPANCNYCMVYGLWGEGTVTSDAKVQFRVGDPGLSYEEEYSCFSGVLDKGVYLFSGGNLQLVGENSVMTNSPSTWGAYESLTTNTLLGVKKFGKIGDAASSVGVGRSLNTDDWGGGYRYIGTGETTDKSFSFRPLTERSYSTIDGGPHGNLVLKGNMSVSSSNHAGMGRLCLAGTNAEPCRVEGSMSSLSWAKNGVAYTFYLLKTGAGIWHLADTADNGKNRAWNGGIAVREGTLRFDSLDNAGIACSLGLATNLTDGSYSYTYKPEHDVDYAFALGGDGTQGTLEFAGSGTTTNGVWSEDRVAVMNGDGRFKNDQDKPFRFKGVRSLSASAKTLTLDGSSTAENTLADVTDDGAGAISLAKNGSGTWTLTGTNSFRGSLAVNGGRLVVANVATNKFSWFRWTIRHATTDATGSASCCVQEFALYSSAGVRQNSRLGVCTNYANIAVGQAAVQIRKGYREDLSVGDGLPWHHLGRLFDNTLNYVEGVADWPIRPADSGIYRRGWQIVTKVSGSTSDQKIVYNDKSSWVPVLMRLNPDTTTEIASYDMAKGNHAGPESYLLEGSPDGLHWTTVDDVDGAINESGHYVGCDFESCVVWGWLFGNGATAGDGGVAQKRSGKAIAGRNADAAWPMLNNVSAVSVAEGAVLEAVGEVTIPNLRVDVSGAGTIRNFAFAPSGNLDVANMSPDMVSAVLPGTYENCTGFENIENWTLSVGGKPTVRYRKDLVDGKIVVSKCGMVLLIR